MSKLMSMVDAGKRAGVDRNTIARWVKGGKLEAAPGMANGRLAMLVDVDAVKGLASQIVAGLDNPAKPRRKAKST